jgi:hypothetical protein
MAKLVHVQILIKKLDAISDEEFHTYWRDPHPKIWLSVDIVKKNVIKYSQFHADQKTSGQLTAAGLPMAEFDGGREYLGEELGRVDGGKVTWLEQCGALLMLSRYFMMKSI